MNSDKGCFEMKNGTGIFSERRAGLVAFVTLLLLLGSLVFADGDSRKPTQAEKDFDKSILNTFAKAVPPPPAGWEKTSASTVITDLRTVYSEINEPFRTEFYAVWQNSKAIQEGQMRMNEELMKLTKKPGFTAKELEDLQKRMEVKDTEARVEITTNVSSQGIQEKAPLPAIAGALTYRSRRSGVTFVFMGNGWKVDPRGADYIMFTPAKKATTSTVVQNLVVKISADAGRTDQIVKGIDWELLKTLINK